MTNGEGTQFLANDGGASALVGTGGKGILRTIEGLSEAEQQNIIEAVSGLVGDTAKKYTAHNQRTNFGLIPVVDEYNTSHGRDFKDTFYQSMVQSHNVSMGSHYSVLGLTKETPFPLLFDLLGDFWGATNFKNEEKGISGLLNDLDKIEGDFNRDYPTPKTQRYGRDRINPSALNKGIDDAIKGALDKALGGYLTTGDFEKYMGALNNSLDDLKNNYGGVTDEQPISETFESTDDNSTEEKYTGEVEPTTQSTENDEYKTVSKQRESTLVEHVKSPDDEMSTRSKATDNQPAGYNNESDALLSVIYKENMVGLAKDYMNTIERIDPESPGYEIKIGHIRDQYRESIRGMMAPYLMHGAMSKGIDSQYLIDSFEKLIM